MEPKRMTLLSRARALQENNPKIMHWLFPLRLCCNTCQGKSMHDVMENSMATPFEKMEKLLPDGMCDGLEERPS